MNLVHAKTIKVRHRTSLAPGFMTRERPGWDWKVSYPYSRHSLLPVITGRRWGTLLLLKTHRVIEITEYFEPPPPIALLPAPRKEVR